MIESLSDYAFKGKNMKVDQDVKRVINEFYSHQKVIGMLSLSTLLGAKVLQGAKLQLTLGGSTKKGLKLCRELEDTLKSFSHKVVADSSVDEVVVDIYNRIVSSPGYMIADAKPH